MSKQSSASLGPATKKPVVLSRNHAVEIRPPLTLTLCRKRQRRLADSAAPLAGRGELKSEPYPPISESPATSKTDPLAPFDGERVRVRGNPSASFRLSLSKHLCRFILRVAVRGTPRRFGGPQGGSRGRVRHQLPEAAGVPNAV